MDTALFAQMFNHSVSPFDNRYYDPKIAKFLSQQAEIQYYIDVEIAFLRVLILDDRSKIDFDISRSELDDFENTCKEITAHEVFVIEREVTHHDITALIHVMKTKTENRILQNLIHLGLTSYDVIHTARSVQLKETLDDLLLPVLWEIIGKLKTLATIHTHTTQSGRTHGQIASPSVFGHSVALIVSRLECSYGKISELTVNMPGKISGPVGTQAALSIITDCPKSLETLVCEYLGLVSCDISSQLLPPDHWMRVYDELCNVTSSLSKFANDNRHLQRAEIKEVIEGFAKNQKGSSAMPHKRNPIGAENIVGCQKMMIALINLVRINQETEHQRDLTGSIVERFYPMILQTAYQILKKTSSILDSLYVNETAMQDNFQKYYVGAISEALKTFIIFNDINSEHISDPYQFVQEACFRAIESGRSLAEICTEQQEYSQFIGSLTQYQLTELRNIIQYPETFIGTAPETIESICSTHYVD